MRDTGRDRLFIILAYALLGLFTLLCLVPFVMTVSVSFTDESSIALNGYRLLPRPFSLENYRYVFHNKLDVILRGYAVTGIVTVLGTLLAEAVSALYAYACSVRSFRYRNALALFATVTMLFSGGLLPWYLILTRYYGLHNRLIALIAPYAMNVFNMYLLRNYMMSLPREMTEAAMMDGAGHPAIFSGIVLPLSKVGVITVGLFYALQFWNDWYLALFLIDTSDLYPLQYLLYIIQSNLQFIISGGRPDIARHITPPLLTSKMVMACLAIGPVILFYPMVQKYFITGIIVGAVKG